MKACSRCGETKPLEQFYRDRGKKDGRRTRCKECTCAQRREYYARPEVKARKAEYNAEYNARPEVRAYRAEYRAEYHAANRETLLERQAEYNARPEVKARRAEYSAEYYQANPHQKWVDVYRRRAKKFGFEPVIERFTRDDLIAKYGSNCWHCGGPFEELDHAVVPVALGGHHTLENCRPSCTPCNAKGRGIRRTNTNETENTK